MIEQYAQRVVQAGSGHSAGTTQTTLRDFSYTPRAGRVDQFRPHPTPTLIDVEFFQARNKFVELAAAPGMLPLTSASTQLGLWPNGSVSDL